MMKRSIANRIAALALALVLAGSLVPGAWAAEGEPEGGFGRRAEPGPDGRRADRVVP